MEKKKLTQVGLAAMERLDLPGQLAADVPQMQLTGKNDFYMLGHKGVLSYSTELIEISGGSILVRVVGSRLQLLAVCVHPCFPVRCCAAGHIARKRLLHLHKLSIAYIQATLDIILNMFF